MDTFVHGIFCVVTKSTMKKARSELALLNIFPGHYYSFEFRVVPLNVSAYGMAETRNYKLKTRN